MLPNQDLRFTLGYRHSDREGDGRAPRAFLLPDSQIIDFDERLEKVLAAADFRTGGWDFHLKQSYRTYKNTDDMHGPAQVEGRDERADTYVTTLKAPTKIGERLDLDAGYIYVNSTTRASLFTRPVILVNPGDAHLVLNTHVGESGLSFLLLPKVILDLDYRFHTLAQAGRGNTDRPPFTTNVEVDFRQFAHSGTFQVGYLPMENLTRRAGYRVKHRNMDTDGQDPPDLRAGEDTLDNRHWVHGWVGSTEWKPIKTLSVLREYQGAGFSKLYTWISPESENIGKARIRWRTPVKNLSLYGTFLWRHRANPDQDYRVDTKDYIFGAAYQPKFAPGLSLDAFLTYEKL